MELRTNLGSVHGPGRFEINGVSFAQVAIIVMASEAYSVATTPLDANVHAADCMMSLSGQLA